MAVFDHVTNWLLAQVTDSLGGLLIAVAVLIGIGVALCTVAVGLGAWSVRHPFFTGFVVLSILLTPFSIWLLLGFWTVTLLVLAAVTADKTDNDDQGWWILSGAFRAGHWAFRHPLVVAVVAGTVFFGIWLAPIYSLAWWAWLACLVWAWHDLHPDSFDRLLVPRCRAAWRSLTVYWPRWEHTMDAGGLTKVVHDQGVSTAAQGTKRRASLRLRPRKLAIRSNAWADWVTASLIEGQEISEWENATEKLADSFGAIACRVHRLDPKRHAVELVFRHGDPLAIATPVPAKPATTVDVGMVPIGTTEDGELLRIPVDVHTQVAGSTGAGKGSVVGSALHSLAPLIEQGLVRLRGCDPKSGLELALEEDLFYDFAYEPHTIVALLERAVADMRVRANRLRGHARKYTLSESDPLDIVLIDEMAEVIHYQPDKYLRERALAATSTLLSQGRAPGTVVWGELQDPRKEVNPLRDLFPQRIGLRLPEKDIVKACMGDEAYERGAHCEDIPMDTPGVGFIWQQELHPEPVRFRAWWVNDDHLRWLADTHPAPSRRQFIDTTSRPAPTSKQTPQTSEPLVFDDTDADDLAAWS